MFVFSRKKSIGIGNSLSCDLKKGKTMEATVIFTPLQDDKFIMKFFFGKERIVSLKYYIRVKKFLEKYFTYARH